jgi:hypothetical protein
MNPDPITNHVSLEELQRLETYLCGCAPAHPSSSRRRFVNAMTHRRLADAAGDLALRDQLQNQAASLYSAAVNEVNSPPGAATPKASTFA